MVPSETVVGRVEEMYDPQRTAAILAQFGQAQQSVGVHTLIGELGGESLEPGWYLEIYEQGLPERVVRLGIGEHIIGRSTDCNIVLTQRCISRIHCILTVHADGHIVLRDLKSTNHVFVNDEQMESEGRCEVQEGMVICASRLCVIIVRRVAPP